MQIKYYAYCKCTQLNGGKKTKSKSIFVASYKGIITTVYKVIIVRNKISGIACTFKLKVHD